MALSHYCINGGCLIRPWCFDWSKHVDLCVVLLRSSTQVYLGIRITLGRHKQQRQQPCRVSVARIQWEKTRVWLWHYTNDTLYWANSLVSQSDQTASGTNFKCKWGQCPITQESCDHLSISESIVKILINVQLHRNESRHQIWAQLISSCFLLLPDFCP